MVWNAVGGYFEVTLRIDYLTKFTWLTRSVTICLRSMLQAWYRPCLKQTSARLKLLNVRQVLTHFPKSKVTLETPVHTTAFSNENDTVLFRIRLPSTLRRRKWSEKSGTIRKRFSEWNNLKKIPFWKRCFPSVDGENATIWKRWRHHNNTTGLQTIQPSVSIQDSFQACSLLIPRILVFWRSEQDQDEL